jgi:hypothetical protein
MRTLVLFLFALCASMSLKSQEISLEKLLKTLCGDDAKLIEKDRRIAVNGLRIIHARCHGDYFISINKNGVARLLNKDRVAMPKSSVFTKAEMVNISFLTIDNKDGQSIYDVLNDTWSGPRKAYASDESLGEPRE